MCTAQPQRHLAWPHSMLQTSQACPALPCHARQANQGSVTASWFGPHVTKHLVPYPALSCHARQINQGFSDPLPPGQDSMSQISQVCPASPRHARQTKQGSATAFPSFASKHLRRPCPALPRRARQVNQGSATATSCLAGQHLTSSKGVPCPAMPCYADRCSATATSGVAGQHVTNISGVPFPAMPC